MFLGTRLVAMGARYRHDPSHKRSAFVSGGGERSDLLAMQSHADAERMSGFVHGTTRKTRHALAHELGWKSCGSCQLDDCCGEIVPLSLYRHTKGLIRCTRPHGHDGEHIACLIYTHGEFAWRTEPT